MLIAFQLCHELRDVLVMVSNAFHVNYDQGQEALELIEDQVKGLFGRRNLKIGFYNPSLARNYRLKGKKGSNEHECYVML
ncbi:hypothetical protein V6N12_009466 [Hibiscus sabdariffa]|uniref:Uncharacterized protein n=1 Tax=Hibiscus sabdariffa TaxID=183260 RepID=A0ABR2E9M7_9ROSI